MACSQPGHPGGAYRRAEQGRPWGGAGGSRGWLRRRRGRGTRWRTTFPAGGVGPAVEAVRPAEARRRGSAADRAGLDIRWPVAGGGGDNRAGWVGGRWAGGGGWWAARRGGGSRRPGRRMRGRGRGRGLEEEDGSASAMGLGEIA